MLHLGNARQYFRNEKKRKEKKCKKGVFAVKFLIEIY